MNVNERNEDYGKKRDYKTIYIQSIERKKNVVLMVNFLVTSSLIF